MVEGELRPRVAGARRIDLYLVVTATGTVRLKPYLVARGCATNKRLPARTPREQGVMRVVVVLGVNKKEMPSVNPPVV